MVTCFLNRQSGPGRCSRHPRLWITMDTAVRSAGTSHHKLYPKNKDLHFIPGCTSCPELISFTRKMFAGCWVLICSSGRATLHQPLGTSCWKAALLFIWSSSYQDCNPSFSTGWNLLALLPAYSIFSIIATTVQHPRALADALQSRRALLCMPLLSLKKFPRIITLAPIPKTCLDRVI